jgi:hypothetical protein
MTSPETLFWKLAAELQAEDPRVVHGSIMNGRCLRVGKEFLALVDFKSSGLVVKLPKTRVEELIEAGVGRRFAPAGRVFKEWLSVPTPDRLCWLGLLREGIAFATRVASVRPSRGSILPSLVARHEQFARQRLPDIGPTRAGNAQRRRTRSLPANDRPAVPIRSRR